MIQTPNEAVRSDLSVHALSSGLAGCRITVCAGGGIAATELPRIARELRRHGARVDFVVTEAALRFIGATSLEWASGAPVVVNPSGLAEHIFEGDAVLVAPATADLLAKAAHGLCTDGVTTLLQSAFGQGKPVYFLPTMHDSLAKSPLVQKNIETLTALPHAHFLEPRREEGKLKAPAPRDVALEICHRWNATRLFNGRSPLVAVTYGGTRVSIDPVRCLTNLSSGKLGLLLAEALYRRGVALLLLQAQTRFPGPSLQNAELLDVSEFENLHGALKELSGKKATGIFHVAAVSDFVPREKSQAKITSEAKDLTLTFLRAPKLLAMENLKDIPFQAACKLTSGEKAAGLDVARRFLETHQLTACLWNHTDTFRADGDAAHEGVILLREEGEIREREVQGKQAIAEALADAFVAFATRPSATTNPNPNPGGIP